MALSQEIKERIFAAADELLAASPFGELPNVEAVRQASRAGMNNVVEAMKEWRQNQRKQVQAVREPLPAELLGVVQSMGQSLWETAQQLANESLEAAKVAFEAEKNDLVQLSTEQSEAYETQAGELARTQARVIELERNAEAAALASQAAAQQLEEARSALLAAEQRAAIAEQKGEEIERRAGELRAELDRAHADAATQRAKLEKAEEYGFDLSDRVNKIQGQLYEATAKAQRAEVEATNNAARLTKAEADRDAATAAAATAKDAAAEARERAAGLAGQLEAVQQQNAALLAAIQTPPGTKAPRSKAAPAKTPNAK